MFVFQGGRGAVEVAFTDRFAGAGRVDALDLAEPPEQAGAGERDTLEESLDILAQALARGGAPEGDNPFELPPGTSRPVVVRMRQVHGGDVLTVDRAWLDARRDAPAGELPRVDALVTAEPGVALLVRAADCVPVLLADVDRRVVAAAHAGRQGLVAGVVPAAVSRLRDLGATRIVAWVGPHICGRCYEVPPAMRDEVAAAVPESFAETSWGTPALDVGAGITAQLAARGVEVVDASACTLEHESLYSHRRDGAAAGRLGGVIWVRP